MSNKKLYFVTDAHLGAGDDSLQREQELCQLLDRIKEDAAMVVFLGDMFDFWFTYRYVVPKGHVRLLGHMAALSDALARTLRGRGILLRLLSMNLYDMEAGSRVENLTAFKRSYGESIRLVRALLAKFRPGMAPAAREAFLWAFFPFLFGVHPYTAVTPKQRAAMTAAGVDFPTVGAEALVRSFVLALLSHPTPRHTERKTTR